MQHRRFTRLEAIALCAAGTTAGCAADGTVGVPGVHMAELSADASRVYVTSSDTNEVVVLDARAAGDSTPEALRRRAYIVSRDSGDIDVIDLRNMERIEGDLPVVTRISVGAHPTHLSMSRDGSLLAVMAEGDNAVSFVDTSTHREVKRLSGFYAPHFLRWDAEGRFAYVANLGAHHVTRVDVATLEIDGHVALDGFDGPPSATLAPEETGFADVQIGRDGVLYAAHAATGRVLLYDTLRHEKLPEITVGETPWIVFAEHPFEDVMPRYLGPNFGDGTVSMIDGDARSLVATLPGDREAYGVNYSPKAPNRAFVMNRIREEIAVVDVERAEVVDRIDVGGNTETASTTADGQWIVATVSDANRIVVIDAETHEISKSVDSLGQYPWSVTIADGQNYCH